MIDCHDARHEAPETSRCNGPDMATRICLDCGTSYSARQASSAFCASACKTAWHTRRRDRGLELYDLYMALRFERDLAKAEHVLTIINGRISDWRHEDKRLRAGRRSWQALGTVLDARPNYRAIALAAATRRSALTGRTRA